jgi:integrase
MTRKDDPDKVLTKTIIDGAAPRADRYVLWDDDPPGFGCRIYPSGKKSFLVQYRLPGSRRTLLFTLGNYGKLTLPMARKEARRQLANAQLGSDPKAAKQQRRAQEEAAAAALTVTKLIDQYAGALAVGAASSKRLRGRPASASYIHDTEQYLNRFRRACGRLEAAKVTRGDIVQVLNNYVRRPSTHRQLHGAISRMYDWALRHDLVTGNPAEHIDTTTAAARERVLSLAELAAIWRAASELEPVYRDAVHLMIATGQRRGEVAGMTWGEVDLGKALWGLPAGRTKARRQHVVPLPALAVACLQARHGASVGPTDLVLPTIGRDGRMITEVSGWNWLKRELDRRSGVKDWRLHDFRRSVVSICAEHGGDIAVLDTLLNHAASVTRAGVVGVYQRATLIEPMRKVMALWDRLLTEALAPDPREAEVIPLRVA